MLRLPASRPRAILARSPRRTRRQPSNGAARTLGIAIVEPTGGMCRALRRCTAGTTGACNKPRKVGENREPMKTFLRRLWQTIRLPFTARRIASLDEIDMACDLAWCKRCRRRLDAYGEGPRALLWPGRYRSVVLACPKCRRRRILDFETSAVFHDDTPVRAASGQRRVRRNP